MMESIKYFILILLFATVAYAAESENSTCNKENCPWHLWNHYEAKGCTPIHKPGKCCPVAYNCSKFEENALNEICQFKGQEYEVKQDINNSNPCHTCRCGPKGIISCTISECFTEANLPNCIPLFEHTKCCPVNQYCFPVGKKAPEELTDVVTCKWQNRTYVEDQIIEMNEHPCLTCICKKGFDGPNSPSCKKVECSFPGNNLKMTHGCCPVYMEKRCCSVDWVCPSPQEEPPTGKSEEVTDEEHCKFGKRIFPLNSTLEIREPCTTCTCLTPPDFTCVRRQCSGPPLGDFVNCHPVVNPNDGCCPQFECMAPGEGPGPGPAMFPQGGPQEGGRPPM